MRIRIVLLVLALLAPAPGAAAGDPTLMGASDGAHLWVLAPADDKTLRILHLHPLPPSGDVSVQRSLRRPPEAMAAWDGRLWMVFPAQAADPAAERRREVALLEARYQEALGGYVTLPPDRMGVAPPLPGDGRLAGLVGGPDGPVALLVDSAEALPDVTEPAGPPGPRLLQQVGGQWQPLELPEDLDPRTVLLLAPAAPGGFGLTMVSRGSDGTLVAHRRRADGTWDRFETASPSGALVGAARLGNPLALLSVKENELVTSYLRPSGLIPLPPVAVPEEAWVALGLSDGLRIIELPSPLPAHGRPPLEYLRMARVDPITGVASPLVPAAAAPRAIARMWHVSLILAIAFTVVVAMVVFRPSGQGVRLPEDLMPLPPASRGAALLLDLVPGAVVSMLVTGVGLRELAESPMWLFTARLERAGPFVLALAVTVLHATATECFAGRSLGKFMVGAKIVSRDGGRPALWRMPLRGVVKFLVLLIPVLVLPGLVNPYLRGLHDLAAGTVVVGERSREERAGGGEG